MEIWGVISSVFSGITLFTVCGIIWKASGAWSKMCTKIESIEKQVKKTNGRVDELEDDRLSVEHRLTKVESK